MQPTWSNGALCYTDRAIHKRCTDLLHAMEMQRRGLISQMVAQFDSNDLANGARYWWARPDSIDTNNWS